MTYVPLSEIKESMTMPYSGFNTYLETIHQTPEPPPVTYLFLGANPRPTPTQFLTFAKVVNEHRTRQNQNSHNIENIVTYLSLDHTALSDPNLPGLLAKFCNIESINIEYPPGAGEKIPISWSLLPKAFVDAWRKIKWMMTGMRITGITAYPPRFLKDMKDLKELHLHDVVFEGYADTRIRLPRPQLETLVWSGSSYEKFRRFVQMFPAHGDDSYCDIGKLKELSVNVMNGDAEERRKTDVLTQSLVAKNSRTLRTFNYRLDPGVPSGINLSDVHKLKYITFTFTPLRSSLEEWLPWAADTLGTAMSTTVGKIVFELDMRNIRLLDPRPQIRNPYWDDLDTMLSTHEFRLSDHVIIIIGHNCRANNLRWIEKKIRDSMPANQQRQALGIDLRAI